VSHRETSTQATEWDGRELVSIKEFARVLSISVWAARKWAYAGKIASVKLGSRLQVPVSEITRMVEENLRPHI
jgi:predicted site-specific integrase-resolvase